MRRLQACALVLAGALAASASAQSPPPPDLQRLAGALAALDGDPALAGKAALERYQAQQALASLRTARSRDREHALWLAEAYVAAAQDAAQAEQLAEQSRQLDRDRDQLLLEASRQQAEAAWREADRLRQMALAREEDAQRLALAQEQDRLVNEQLTADAEAANAQASQAMKLADARAREIELARQQAELSAALEAEEGTASPPPMRRVGNRRIHTLPGTAFASGSDRLSPAAAGSLRALAAEVAGKRLRVEAHTDSQGSDAANLALSQKRAEAVRQVLASAGMAAARITAVGVGETDPITDNGSADGRARNRRVEITVE